MYFLILLSISSVLSSQLYADRGRASPRALDACTYPSYCNVDWGYYEDASGACCPCNVACGSCTGPTSYECTQCSSTTVMMLGICMSSCALGYSNSGGVCVSLSTTGIVYDLDFTLIQNTVVEKVKVSSAVMQISCGSSSQYYPTYDTNDPYAVEGRGFYFDGNAYFTNNDNLLVFAPAFTLGMWVSPSQGTSYVYAKQNSAQIYIAVTITNYYPALLLYVDTTLNTFTASNALTASAWNFLMVQVALNNYLAQILISVGTSQSQSSVLSDYFTDITSSFYSTTGAMLSNSAYANFYTGFMWSFTLYNIATSLSSFAQTTGCSGCSICPINNSNQCLSTCNYLQYTNGGVCEDCTSECQTFGCSTNDIKCNLCLDLKCYICNSFLATCTQCISNAYLVGSTSCVCNYNYVWDIYLEECRPCSPNCATCDGGGYLGCSSCKPGYYLLWGLCMSFCPTGYEISGGTCVLIGSSTVLNLTLSGIQGVVYDSASQIPVVAGSSDTFYPTYTSDDPIAAIGRGYYFTGSSVMHFAPYSTYTSPFLNFGPVFYIGLWIDPVSSNGIIFSDVSPSTSYSIIVQISLISGYPSIVMALSQSTAGAAVAYPSYTCASSVTLNAWSFVVFSVYLDSHEQTFVTCYINNIPGTQYLVGQGHFTDVSQNNNMMLGTTQTGLSTTSSNTYNGFVYQVLVNVDLADVTNGATTTCSSTCSICPLGGTCLNICGINSYPSDSTPSDCSSCNSACSSTSCRNSNSDCNLCEDDDCEVCTDYTGQCTLYKCNTGYYKLPGMASCEACDASCTSCSNSGPTACTSCTTGDLLNGSCHPFCPTGYTTASNVCTLALSPVVNLDLTDIKGIVTDSQTGFQTIAGSSSTSFYPNFDPNDPWPIQNRGYYFYSGSYLQFPPNSVDSSLLTLGNQFTISLWIHQNSAGVILDKKNSAYNSFLTITISSYVTLLMNLSGGIQSASSTKTLASGWNYIGISAQYTSSGSTTLTFYTNQLTETVTSGAGYYSDVTTNFLITIGAEHKSTGYTNYWIGTLYMFKIYPLSLSPLDYSLTCDTSTYSCTICPYLTKICLETCEHGYWWSQNACTQCDSCSYSSCVRQDTVCNLCFDVACQVCSTFESGSCSQCKPNAVLSSGSCACATSYYWDNPQEACEYCDPSTHVMLQGVCLEACPTGYTNSAGTCTGTGAKIFEIVMDSLIRGDAVDSVGGLITVQTGISASFYPTYDLTDPYAGQNRGYFFNGYSSYMTFLPNSNNQNQLVLSPEFAIGLWVYPVSPGVLFARQSSGSLGLLLELTASLNLQVSGLFYSSSSLASLTSASVLTKLAWNYVGVTFAVLSDTSTQTTIVINTQTGAATSISSTPYIDFQSAYTCTLGAQYNSSLILTGYYTGYIRSVTVWNYPLVLTNQVTSLCTGGCSLCPITGNCLTNCGLAYYYSQQCQPCSDACGGGCVRAADCNLCYDRLCYRCGDYTATGCTQCVDGASFVGGVCQCNSGLYSTEADGNLYCSTTCMANCLTCYSKSNGDCASCVSGYYLGVDGLCLPECQSGYMSSGSVCVAEYPNSVVLHYVFNQTVNDPRDITIGLLAFMGSSINYTGNFDVNDPLPAYMRGIYFSGTAKYANLPVNPDEDIGVTLGNTHSIKIWLRPTQLLLGCVMVKESATATYLYLYLDTSLTPHVAYTVLGIQTAQSASFTATGNTLILDTWQELVVVFQRSGEACTATIFLNGIPGPTSLSPQSYFSELNSYSFKLGYSSVAASSYQGFIYEIIIFNFAINPIVPAVCGCGVCTEDGTCLSTCDFLYYITSSGACAACISGCTTGCVNGVTCSNNNDPLCETYSGYTSEDCTGCVALASETSSGCQCGSNTVASPTSCACLTDYENYQNQCLPCFYSIQASDIDSYFSKDYSSLIFDFAVPLQSSTSSDCSVLFYVSSVESFGVGPVCTWSNNFQTLTVTLGQNATVYTDTVTFQANTLLTNIVACGVSRGPTSTTVYLKYSAPITIPTAIIDAPFDYFIFCGDLILDGSRSTGGHGRPLKFLWSFTSNPTLDVLTNSQEMNHTGLEYANTTLSPTAANASLTVTNWLGFSNTAWQYITINAGVGISLVLDKDIVWRMTTEDSKSIYVQAQSECTISDNLTYTWSLYSQSGTDAYVNKELLWSSQKTPSKLYIPAGSLGPGTYVFLLVVTDNDLNVTGMTMLKIVISYSDLVVNFNPPYMKAMASKTFMLDGSVAQDPDHTSSLMNYTWTCVSNGNNCTSLISDPSAEQPTVAAGSMSIGSEYNFTLKVFKDTRTASDSMVILASNSTGLSVSFSMIPKYVNNQENFVIRPYLGEGCNCTYKWSLISGPGLIMSTDANSLDLGIQPGSMKAGQVYVVQVTVTAADGTVSTFREYFTVDISATGGLFYVDKYTGLSFQTVFKLAAPDWFDPKDPTNPLTYQFGYYFENITYFLNMRNESSTFYTTFPAGNLVPFVRIYDKYGTYVEQTDIVSVSNSSITVGQMIDKVNYLLNLSWTDPDILPGVVSSLALFVSERSANDTEILQAFNASNNCIDALRESLVNADFANIDVLLQMVNVTTLYEVDKGNKSELFQQLGSITQVINENSVIMSSERAQEYVEVISNISPFNYTTVVMDTQDLYQANSVLKDLCLAASLTMGQTQSIEFGSASIISYCMMYQGDLVWNFNTQSHYNTSYVSLPLTPELLFNSSETILSVFIAYNTQPLLFNTTSEYSSGIEFSLYQISNNTQVKLDFNFTETINLTIPVWNLEVAQPRCGYLDVYDWSNSGCVFLGMTLNGTLCGCTHTSLYSSGSHLGQGPDTGDLNSGPILIFLVCIVAFIWLILACCLVCKDRKEGESKVFVDKILAGLPAISGKKDQRFKPNAIADQLGRNHEKAQRNSEKKDSEYVPAEKIGVIGAYFDEKPNLESIEKEEFQMSGPQNYHGDSLKLKPTSMIRNNPFKHSEFEEVKETDMDSDTPIATYKSAKSNPYEGYSNNMSILPQSDFTRDNKGNFAGNRMGKVNPLELDPQVPGAKEPGSTNAYQSGPRLAGVSPMDLGPSAGKTGKPTAAESTYKTGPRLGGVIPLELETDLERPDKSGRPERDSEYEGRREGLKITEIRTDGNVYPRNSDSNKNTIKVQNMGIQPLEIDPSGRRGSDEAIEHSSVVGSYFVQRRPSQKKRFDEQIEVDDLTEKKIDSERELFIGSAEMAGGEPKAFPINKQLLQPKPLEEEKITENTELFTQPDLPRGQSQFRRKKYENQEVINIEEEAPRRYTGWIADYYFSAVLFYHVNYSRFARCCQGVCSFFLQTILIGIIINGMGTKYADDKGSDLDSQAKNIVFQDVAISFSMVIISNLLVGMMLCCLLMKRTVNQFLSENERRSIEKRNMWRSRIGFGIAVIIIVGTVVGVGIIEMKMKPTGSLLWVICLFIAFIIDFFLVQILKVLVYGYYAPGFILPIS